MTRAKVIAALERYEVALRRIGSPVVANLRPGISAPAIRALEVRFGVELADEVRAIWEWHDGVDGARGAPATDAARTLVPYRAFGDLEWSLEFAHEFTATAAANPTSDFAAGRKFVSLLIDNVGFVVNITSGEPVLTYVNDPMSWAMSDYPSMPIDERVGWWTWAIESGAWGLSETGDWKIDVDLYPQDQNRNVRL